MIEFFREGGFGMFVVLAAGLLAIGSAARYAMDLYQERMQVVSAALALVLASAVGAFALNISQVCIYAQDRARVSDADLSRVLLTGTVESMRPILLGLAMVVSSLILVLVAKIRVSRRELRL